MCTVTYLPLAGGGFIITSNRDESTVRKPALHPAIKNIGGIDVLFPKDQEAGGTWIAAGSNGRIACLLNGAFVKHKHLPPYQKSRGLVVLDLFGYASAEKFVEEYDLEGIEPFTIVCADRNENFAEIRWDGGKKHLKEFHSEKPGIWSSVTLYSEEIMAMRRKWFADWLKMNAGDPDKRILDFHHFGGEESNDLQNKVVMSRGEKLRTLSITSIRLSGPEISMRHKDLITNTESTHTLPLSR